MTSESAVETQVKALRAACAELRYAARYRGGMDRQVRNEVLTIGERLAQIELELSRRVKEPIR